LISFSGVPSSAARGRWGEFEPLIRLPLERTGAIENYQPEDILDRIEQGFFQCWAVSDGGQLIAALVTQILNYPRRKVLDVYLVGGKDMNKWADNVWLALKEYGRQNGCTAARGFGREGWVKRLGVPEYDICWSVEL
jgi:hypothetical protein